MNEPTEIWAKSEPWNNRVSLLIKRGNATAEPITMKLREELEILQPAINLTTQEAQNLIDNLWSCGLRPTEGSGSAGSLAATERHLKDLQRIVFKDQGK